MSPRKAVQSRSPFAAATLALLLGAIAAPRGIADEPAIENVDGKHLDILHGGKSVVRYMYAFDTSSDEARHATYKVYHHVMDPSGDQPITKGPGGKFTHHRGLFIGFARTRHGGKSYDLWHMKNGCTLVHQKFVETKTTGHSATVSSTIDWRISPETTIIEELRTVEAHFDDSEAHVVVDWSSELKAVAGDVLLSADPEHGGMQYRPANEVAENKSAKYTFPAPDTDPKRDKDLAWVALTYRLGEQTYTVQQMRHPENPIDSVFSAYRDYGRFGNYFSTTIADGETLKLNYRFRITLGDAPSREQLAAHYRQYVGAQ